MSEIVSISSDLDRPKIDLAMELLKEAIDPVSLARIEAIVESSREESGMDFKKRMQEEGIKDYD